MKIAIFILACLLLFGGAEAKYSPGLEIAEGANISLDNGYLVDAKMGESLPWVTVGTEDWCDYVTDGTADHTEINSALSANDAVILVSNADISGSIIVGDKKNFRQSPNTVITAHATFGNSSMVLMSGSNSAVSRLVLDGNKANNNYSRSRGINSTGNFNTIEDCEVYNVSSIGILNIGDNVKILRCYVHNIGNAGIYTIYGICAYSCREPLIEDNTVDTVAKTGSGANSGMGITTAGTLEDSGVSFPNVSRLYSTEGISYGSLRALVTGNNIQNCADYCHIIGRGNVVSNNKLSGPSSVSPATELGIDLGWFSENCVVNGNTGNGLYNGVWLEGGTGNVITGNTFVGVVGTGDRGISITAQDHEFFGSTPTIKNTTIATNHVTGFQSGIILDTESGDADAKVSDTTIYGNNVRATGYGIYGTSTGSTVNRTSIIANTVFLSPNGIKFEGGVNNTYVFGNSLIENLYNVYLEGTYVYSTDHNYIL